MHASNDVHARTHAQVVFDDRVGSAPHVGRSTVRVLVPRFRIHIPRDILFQSACLSDHESSSSSNFPRQECFLIACANHSLGRSRCICHASIERPRKKHRQRVPIDDPAVIAAGVTERDETDEEQMLRDVVRYVRKQMLATASMAPARPRNSSRM